MLCWECIGAGVYLWSGGRAFPPQAHKLRSCHLSHLPSNTESEHSTAPGPADRPGRQWRAFAHDSHPAVFANVPGNYKYPNAISPILTLESTCSIMKFEAALKTASLSLNIISISSYLSSIESRVVVLRWQRKTD